MIEHHEHLFLSPKIGNKAFLFCLISLLAWGCHEYERPEEFESLEATLPQKIDFNLHVKPILSDKCFACHGPDEASREAGLELATPEGAFAALKDQSNQYVIVAGKPGQSEVFHRIMSEEEDYMMPPPSSNLSLTLYEKAVITRWIAEGAEYKPHWPFIKPEKLPLPEVQQKQWIQNPIDQFILANLEKMDKSPSPEADRATLLRRLSLDLIGLPPSLEEIDAFVNDHSENAYEKVVDRLLASSAYGERMAIDWMDAARYADTHGYTVDRYRPMWPWRDWVIHAFNKNMPYDQFASWQLAGDLLPESSKEQKIATAYNRNHAQNMEGGIVNEEFRVEYVVDRTNTLGTNFLGMTVECARCHDHKYDPVSQKEYYELFAFFNQVDEAGQISWDDAMPVPTLLLSDEKEDSLIHFIDQKIAETEGEINTFRKTVQEENVPSEILPNVSDLQKGLQAHFSLDNSLKSTNRAFEAAINDPKVVNGIQGKALQLNGDEVLDLGQVGVFQRANPFTISIWVNIPQNLTEGVIFHKGNGAILYNFKGYHLAIKENTFELLMAHTWPYNNIIKISAEEIPREEWIHLAFRYDGSSRANGLQLFMNGKAVEMHTEKDNLYKDIHFANFEKQPGLQIGARWRGVGFKNGLVDEISVYERALSQVEIKYLSGQKSITSQELQPEELSNYILFHQQAGYRKLLQKLESLRAEKNAILEEVEEIMVMDELEEKRPTYVLDRGSYDAHVEEVQPNTPDQILPFPEDLPKNRLGLAQWLFHEDHPLTSRVAVNRYWQHFFGKGLVSTSADFGNQGNLPSHPELLDWMAVHFRESDWDMKAMQKMIVMSSTYRQSSYTPPELMELDPDNLLYARGPSARLSAELIRDHALASSDLLVQKLGGPSVKPYQPEGLWAFNGGKYEQEHDEKLYRRSLYTFWKRTVPPPSMNTFDAPDRSYCVVNRQETSTPLQALILMNDPQFVEAARHLAEKVLRNEDQTEERIQRMYRLLTAREAKKQELEILKKLVAKESSSFSENPEKMSGWLSSGENHNNHIQDKALLASYTVLANTIMNSDAFITKR